MKHVVLSVKIIRGGGKVGGSAETRTKNVHISLVLMMSFPMVKRSRIISVVFTHVDSFMHEFCTIIGTVLMMDPLHLASTEECLLKRKTIALLFTLYPHTCRAIRDGNVE